MLKVLGVVGQKINPGRLESAGVGSNGVDDLGHLVVNVTALVHPLGHSAVGIHHGGVIAVSENLTNLRQ